MRPLAGLALIACLSLAGCADVTLLSLTGPEPTATPKTPKKIGAARPVGSKAYYLRMSEIDRTVTVLTASERRRIRRLKAEPSLAERRRRVLASLDTMDRILLNASDDLKRLGPAPSDVRPLRNLWLDELRRDRGSFRRLRATVKRGDPASIERQSTRLGRGDSPRHDRIDDVEASLRRKLGFKRKPPKAYVAPPAASPSLDVSSYRTRVSRRPRVEPFARPSVAVAPGQVREDLAFVDYVSRLKAYIARHNRTLREWGEYIKAHPPADPTAMDTYVYEKLSEALAQDQEGLAGLNELGTPPAEARDYIEKNRRRLQRSADALATILASGDNAQGMIQRLNNAQEYEEVSGLRRANLAAFAPARARLERIYRRGTVPRSVWDKLKG